MGLLDQIFDGLVGNAGGASPIQDVFMSMLGGNRESGPDGPSAGMSGGHDPWQSLRRGRS